MTFGPKPNGSPTRMTTPAARLRSMQLKVSLRPRGARRLCQVGTSVLHGDEAVRVTREALRPLEVALGVPLPFIVVHRVEQLRDALLPLREEPARLEDVQRRTADWWAAVKRHYSGRFERMMCNGPPGEA